MNRRTMLNIGIVLLIIIGLIWFNNSYLNVKPDMIREWILSFGVFAPVIFILIYSIRPLILFPASILSLAAGLAFGAFWGTIYTIVGATAGAILAFFLARVLGSKFVKGRWKGKGKAIETQLEKNGFLYVLLLRFIPLFNFDMISYISGLSKVRFTHFLVATVIGMIPATFAYNFLGSSLLASSWWVLGLALLVFVAFAILPVMASSSLREKLGFVKNGEKNNA
ncbi:TVP38/TMEM64 family protein [Bacillus sp. HMF5848]|uniref:TVP38/TMEM64 family protein n=1 Tax=Bacillus sp. HMF5848 TaxID=2495421 RepID=UPI000F77C41B|nr:TVP38/TMEM64 family protein [Bacillus sp. HMF5848]RSK27570.1 TVP38/TMEM64 family protein [Bacillus sp. HMF5848]